MKALFSIMKRESVPIMLVLISFLPLFFIGSLLDIFLTHLYAAAEKGETALPVISRWVHNSIAGNRMLPQEMMSCFWLLLVILFIANVLTSHDQRQFRIRFIYSFLFTWLLSITTAFFIALACILPSDLLLSRIDGQGLLSGIIRIILIIELALVVIVPTIAVIFRRTKKLEK